MSSLRRGAALVVVLAALCIGQPPPAAAEGSPPAEVPVELDLASVELADNQAERAQGLMFRRELCERCGMLFIFEKPRTLSFWMKNTYLPLDIIFLDPAGRILSIHHRTTPHREFPPYSSGVPALYALEVNAGFASTHRLEPGQIVDLADLRRRLVEYRAP